MNSTGLLHSSTAWKIRSMLLGLLALTSLLTTSCADSPRLYYTGKDYIRLHKGETFTADREMTLATEAVVQEKDEQILQLLKACKSLEVERTLRKE